MTTIREHLHAAHGMVAFSLASKASRLMKCTRPHPYPCRVLDRTKTKCGARLLRANLLQPLRDITTLNAR